MLSNDSRLVCGKQGDKTIDIYNVNDLSFVCTLDIGDSMCSAIHTGMYYVAGCNLSLVRINSRSYESQSISGFLEILTIIEVERDLLMCGGKSGNIYLVELSSFTKLKEYQFKSFSFVY